MVVRQGNYTGLNSPARLMGTPGAPGRPPPDFAQDTEEVLLEAGFNEKDIAHLRDSGAAPRPNAA
jgi:crotonobetainyl-CoA:carnitine CoA-transferase CaiB-like acyl-CoA transferase